MLMKRFTIILISLLSFITADAQLELSYTRNMDFGWGDAGSVATPYIFFPGDYLKPYAGASIVRVNIGLLKDASNCYLYIKENPNDEQYIYRQKLGDLPAGWNEIELETPFEVTGDRPVSIGYRGSFKSAGGVGCGNEKNPDGDHVYYNSKNTWTTTGGSIAIRAELQGDALPVNEMAIGRLSDRMADYEETEVTFTTTVRNGGANAVENYDLELTVNGETSALHIDRRVPVNGTDAVSFTVPSTVKGEYPLTLRIVKVNGVADTYEANNSASAVLRVRDRAFMRRVVCEEYGGTWCGFCPRGIVGLEKMTALHPDRFIGISAHGGDPLEIQDESISYKPFIASCAGAPFCNVNRHFRGDPYIDIKNLFDLESKDDNHLAYEMTARWDENGENIVIDSEYFTDIDIKAPQYNIAFTVTEDGITGYKQTNYFAGGRNGELDGWENKTDPTDDFVYNDIARAIYGGYAGMALRREDITAGERYTHSYTIPVPANVTDRTKIKVVGQVIDSASGYILNAARTVPGTSGIISVTENQPDWQVNGSQGCIHIAAPDTRADVFDMSGRLCASAAVATTADITLQPGLYIVTVRGNDKCKSFKIKI